MKKFLASIIALLVVGSMVTTAFAVEIPTDANVCDTSKLEQSATPRIYWNGTAWLSTDAYYTITTSNNFFNDDPLVESDGNNPGKVTIRVLNQDGQQVGSTKTVEPGFSVRLDMIPFDSGTYRIQGKAEVAGNYKFIID